MEEEQENTAPQTPAIPPVPQEAIQGIAKCLDTIRQYEEYYNVKLAAYDDTEKVSFRVIPGCLATEAPWLHMDKKDAQVFPWESMPALDYTAMRYDDSLDIIRK